MSKFAKEISKTGFVLESKVYEILHNQGWTVISNKYYEDDFQGNVREIDLLAYKVSKVQHFSVYTTLLISCKKNEKNVWALLARDKNIKDPNAEWWPLHAWSNDKAIVYELSKSDSAKRYHNELIEKGVKEALSLPDYEVFAFQEMNQVSGTPQNDKAIFSSLTSLMKAQAYELGSLPNRKKTPSIYQFNLLSVVDSDIVRLRIDGDKIIEESIESEHYISRYIIKRRETFSRIRFVKADCFVDKLRDYSKLHQENCFWFDKVCNDFFKNIFDDYKRWSILREDFLRKVKRDINYNLINIGYRGDEIISLFFDWDKTKNILNIKIKCEESFIYSLNENQVLKKEVSSALKKIYRFTGDYQFAVDDCPY